MGTASDFQTFVQNLAITNHETIELRYEEITKALNKAFRDLESSKANSLQVGSYGRWTAIKGVSDLDMLYIMPSKSWADYANGGQYKLLKAAADAISTRYPKTDIKVDRLVVRVLYQNFHVEMQPVFQCDDGSFKYPDSYGGGSWKVTRPQEEMDALAELNTRKNRNVRRLCKILRAWKNKHGVGMGGLLIDTLVANFFEQTQEYDAKSFSSYDLMCRDLFAFLKDQPNQDYYAAVGSGQRVKVKKRFQAKAKKAHNLCLEAIAADNADVAARAWRKVFGKAFPRAEDSSVKKAYVMDGVNEARNTEEYFEDRFPIDIRNTVTIECDVTQSGFRPFKLTEHLKSRLWLKRERSLRFHIAEHDVQKPYDVFWKVTNRGPEAVRRDMIRGQILRDSGCEERVETSNFFGDHVVDCAIVKNGVIVATDRIHVPIE